jgi:hypothetical protein
MKLYFINGSKQKKLLLESDYSDDIYDTLIGFFEEHERFPHILKAEMTNEGIRISFESSSESFLVEDASEEEAKEIKDYIRNW